MAMLLKNYYSFLLVKKILSYSAWYAIAEKSEWRTPGDVKNTFAKASIIGNNRVVFNICGNSYRLTVKIEYKIGLIFIRHIGTHKEYDKIDAEEI